MKFYRLQYTTRKGDQREGHFVKIINRYFPVLIGEGYLAEDENKINKTEEITLDSNGLWQKM